jgi:hypothetical protein
MRQFKRPIATKFLKFDEAVNNDCPGFFTQGFTNILWMKDDAQPESGINNL